MKNQRKSNRQSCEVPVEGQQGGLFDKVQTIDISPGGLGFVSDKEIPVNQKIVVELLLPDQEESALATVKVKWSRPIANSDKFRVGLSFDDVFRGSKSRLKEYFSKIKQD